MNLHFSQPAPATETDVASLSERITALREDRRNIAIMEIMRA
jgi:hypothetical protein